MYEMDKTLNSMMKYSNEKIRITNENAQKNAIIETMK